MGTVLGSVVVEGRWGKREYGICVVTIDTAAEVVRQGKRGD